VQSEQSASPQLFARDTKFSERRAVDLVLATERALGRLPEEQPRNNPGFDIRSTDRDGHVFYIEVKGKIEQSNTFTITTNEIEFSQSQGYRYRLALVSVSPDGAEHDQLRYVFDAFTHITPSITTQSLNEEWKRYWHRGESPR